MLVILIRTVILYLLVLFVIRVMGKGELSRMGPFEMIILFMIAELAALPIEAPDMPLLNGAAAILTLLFLEVSLSFLSTKSTKIYTLLNGKPSVLIDGGRINEKEMKSQRITISDLMEQLRLKDQPSIADVNYAILEANGELSVIPKPEKAAATRSDIGAPVSPETMPLVLISDGTLYKNSLRMLGKDENFLKQKLSKANIKEYSEVFLCFSDENSRLHIYPKGKNGNPLKKEVNLQ